MKAPVALKEKLLKTSAAFLFLGGVALAGCTSESDESANSTPTIAYEIPAEVDALPEMADYERYYREPSSSNNIDAGDLSRDLEDEAYETLSNDHEDEDAENRLPADPSAPLIDILVGSDGELRFQSPNEQLDRNETYLLSLAHAAEPMLSAALKSGDIRQAHFRIFQPDIYGPEHSEWEPTLYAKYVKRDSNDNGNPAIYFFLPADGFIDTEAGALLFSHEVAHALAGHAIDAPLPPEQAETFTQACSTIHDGVQEHIQQDSWTLTRSLDYLQTISPPEYGPVLEEIRDALESGTYQNIPLAYPEAAHGVPACYLQHPWEAFKALVKDKNINNGDLSIFYDKLDELGTGLEFEEEVNELVEDWHDIVKEHAIVNALTESTYLSPGNEAIGHPHEGRTELEASTGNLALTVPEELGEHVAALDPDQQTVTLTVIEEVVNTIKKRYENDAALVEFVDRQYEIFLSKIT